ncbi:MAG TPA: hypothetical protein ENJ00_10590 [Phycisphaerales bacterium]|nr:hypothetical protein [Phycisphaerales bacterium]
MNTKDLVLTSALGFALTAGAALADNPVLGGPMLHLLISQNGNALEIDYETPVSGPVELFQYPNDTYTGPAAVLNGTYYNAQFGWLANGFFSLPPGSGVFVQKISSSADLRVYNAFDFSPILGTNGSSDVWQWTGEMTHNWYAADGPGQYTATYRVYVGDATTSQPLAGWGDAMLTLEWFVPNDCLADVNADGNLDATDFTAWIAAFNANDPKADQNQDGSIDPSDFTAWIANFNAGC